MMTGRTPLRIWLAMCHWSGDLPRNPTRFSVVVHCRKTVADLFEGPDEECAATWDTQTDESKFNVRL
jgi:hypothetical protein